MNQIDLPTPHRIWNMYALRPTSGLTDATLSGIQSIDLSGCLRLMWEVA
jgi:hypothetical protein